MARLNIGAKVEVEKLIDLSPYTYLKPGERGEIVDTEEVGLDERGVYLKLNTPHYGLRDWDNTALLVGADAQRLKRLSVWKTHTVIVFLSAALLFAAGAIAEAATMSLRVFL